MNEMTRFDPETVVPLQAFLDLVGGSLNLDDIPALRAGMDQAVAAAAAVAAASTVALHERRVPGPAGGDDILVKVYQPQQADPNQGVLLWLHGGGFVLGSVAQDDALLRELVEQVGCSVVAVEYRLAPEHPFPAALDDCYAALRWVATDPGALGLVQPRIAVAGASAGGGLAACLALLARDRGEVNLIFQALIYPMLDDRNIAPAGPECGDTVVWTRANNRAGWHAYLAGQEEVSPYAAAARAGNLAGLPPAYIAIGEHDLFLHENIDYAQRLLQAGVPAELHVYPGAYHGFDAIAAASRLAQRFIGDRNAVLKNAFAACP